MKCKFSPTRPGRLLILAIGVMLGSQAATGQTETAAPATLASCATIVQQLQADKPITPRQEQLLALAYDAASSIQVDPHVKTRSLEQGNVISACLKLGQFQKAMAYLQDIRNWRQAQALADVIYALTQAGKTQGIEPLLKLAEDLSNSPGMEDWRRGKIRVRVGQAYVWVGNEEKAASLQSGVDPSEYGLVSWEFAKRATEDSFATIDTELRALAQSPHFEVVNHGLRGQVELIRIFHADAQRRQSLQEHIRQAWGTIPVTLRMELLEALVKVELEKNQPEQARALLNEIDGMVGTAVELPLQYEVPLKAHLAELWQQMGEKEKARGIIDAIWQRYQTEESQTIINMYRADALAPLAEAFWAIGDKETAGQVYAKALEESLVNRAARPRAEDLSLLALSMAVQGYDPDPSLWAQMQKIREGLVHP